MCTFEVSIGLFHSSWLSHQKNPCYRCLMKIFQHQANHLTNCIQIWSKHMVVPCYSSVMKIHQHGAVIFSKMCSFEVSIGLYPSLWSSHQKNPCYRSLMKIHQHGVKIFRKMCTYEVSIGMFPSLWFISWKESLLWKSHGKSINMGLRYLANCALLK